MFGSRELEQFFCGRFKKYLHTVGVSNLSPETKHILSIVKTNISEIKAKKEVTSPAS